MQFRLVIEKNGKRSRVVPLSTACARIGRAHGNEVRIPSAEISRRHCELRVDDGLLKVEDLESINGTYLNGDLITGEAVVRPGDRLEIGPVAFIVEYELTPAAVERLRAMDYEVVVEDDVTEEDLYDAEEEPAPPPRRKARRPVVEDEEVMEVEPADEEEALEAEEIVEAEDYNPRFNLDEVNWTGSGDGLHDLLSHLDEGQESLMPKKRPAPRKPPRDADEPTNPKGKQRPETEDE